MGLLLRPLLTPAVRTQSEIFTSLRSAARRRDPFVFSHIAVPRNIHKEQPPPPPRWDSATNLECVSSQSYLVGFLSARPGQESQSLPRLPMTRRSSSHLSLPPIPTGLGVIISTTAPNWIGFHANDRDDQNLSYEVNYGPFYGQSRECRDGTCGRWSFRAINSEDCTEVESDFESLCNQMNTFRGVGIICLILTLIGGALVFGATCCQTLTCGCCGNSLTCVSNVLFGIETILSIVAWSFASECQPIICKDQSTIPLIPRQSQHNRRSNQGPTSRSPIISGEPCK